MNDLGFVRFFFCARVVDGFCVGRKKASWVFRCWYFDNCLVDAVVVVVIDGGGVRCGGVT